MAEDERTAPTARENDTREVEARFEDYRPPSNLPDPHPQAGYEFRWVRTSMLDNPDNQNVSQRMREGWQPVQAEDHPELQLMSDINSTFAGNVVIGGLMLCKALTEQIASRTKYYANKNQQQANSVDHNFMRENDPRMPLLETESTSSVSFGGGRGRRS